MFVGQGYDYSAEDRRWLLDHQLTSRMYLAASTVSRMSRAKDQFLVFGAMHAPHIGTSVHYLSIPEHPYYRERFGWRPEAYPNAQRIGQQAVSEPCRPSSRIAMPRTWSKRWRPL